MTGLVTPGTDSIVLSAVLLAPVMLVALAIDRWIGEPPAAVHPVVWMGHYLKVAGSLAVRCGPALAFVTGALGWCLGAAGVGALAWAVQSVAMNALVRTAATPDALAWVSAFVAVLAAAWILKSMLSWRMLHEEAGAVEAALRQSVAAGRQRLSWLVSRDTGQLSESEVRQSAIESMAENLNDSVIAPLFWFVLLGLPGAAVYRFANTADAMWGYRGLRHGVNWEWAGKWAARADDVLSWLPARITAMLLAAVGGGLKLSTLRTEARKTPSPNSGWPMAAMALLLGVSLSKPEVYVLNPAGRPVASSDMAKAKKYASKVVLAYVLIALLAMIKVAVGDVL